jgi:hypothetical protein
MTSSPNTLTPGAVTVMRRTVRALCLALLVGGTALLGASASPAQAASNGPVTVTPSAGSVEDTIALRTSGGCPASASWSKSRIVGPGFPKRGQNLSGVAPGNTSRTKPFEVESAYTLRDTASLAYPPVTYGGTYRLEVVCVSPSKGEVGVFATTITFTDAVHWKATSPSAVVKPGPTATVPPITSSASSAPDTSTSPAPGASTSAAASESDSAAPSTTTSPDPSGTTSDSSSTGDVSASGSDSGSSTPTWLPLVAGVVLGGVAVGGASVLLQRRQGG